MPNVKVGHFAAPVNGREMRSGASAYWRAVVASLVPLILISEEGDMAWTASYTIEDLQGGEPADAVVLGKVVTRMLRSYPDNVGDLVEVIKALAVLRNDTEPQWQMATGSMPEGVQRNDLVEVLFRGFNLPVAMNKAENWVWTHTAVGASDDIVGWRRYVSAPKYGESFGYKLAMRVLQSSLYGQLHDDERAECDELLRRGREPS